MCHRKSGLISWISGRYGQPEMKEIYLSKMLYSQMVVRNSLYWCSPEGEWLLQETDENWIVQLNGHSALFETTLHRHLNDFVLRETLEEKTRVKKEKIILAALTAVLKSR